MAFHPVKGYTDRVSHPDYDRGIDEHPDCDRGYQHDHQENGTCLAAGETPHGGSEDADDGDVQTGEGASHYGGIGQREAHRRSDRHDREGGKEKQGGGDD